MICQVVNNVLASANKFWQFGRLCDSSLLPIHSSIPITLATLSPFNSTDYASQLVPHSRASHDFSDFSDETKQNMGSLCFLNHNKDSICPIISRSPDPEISPNHCHLLKCHHFQKLQWLQYQYVQIRYDSVPYHVLYVPIKRCTILGYCTRCVQYRIVRDTV